MLAICYRPLLFATADPEVAAARGVPVRVLGVVFAALVGVVAAQGVQIVGALLVMSLLITPAAAAARVVGSPAAIIALGGVRRAVRGTGHRVLAGARSAGLSIRRDNLFSDLPVLLATRATPGGPRLSWSYRSKGGKDAPADRRPCAGRGLHARRRLHQHRERKGRSRR